MLDSSCPRPGGGDFGVFLYSEIRSRVSRYIVEAYLEMEVVTGTVSGTSYKSDQLSLIYHVSYIYKYSAAVSVSGHSSVAMIDIDAVTVTGIVICSDYLSAVSSVDRCASRRRHIDS